MSTPNFDTNLTNGDFSIFNRLTINHAQLDKTSNTSELRYRKYALTIYYHIVRPSLNISTYINPDVRISLQFSDGNYYTTGWQTKQADNGNYEYKKSAGIGSITVQLGRNQLKSITKISIEIKRNNSDEVSLRRVFELKQGMTIYNSVWISNSSNYYTYSSSILTLPSDKLHPYPFGTSSDAPVFYGASGSTSNSIKNTEYFDKYIHISFPEIEYLGYENFERKDVKLVINENIVIEGKKSNTENYYIFDCSQLNLEKTPLSYTIQYTLSQQVENSYTGFPLYYLRDLESYCNLEDFFISTNKLKQEQYNETPPLLFSTYYKGSISYKSTINPPLKITEITATFKQGENEPINDNFFISEGNQGIIALDKMGSINTTNLNKPNSIVLKFSGINLFDTTKIELFIDYTKDIIQESPFLSKKGLKASIGELDFYFYEEEPIVCYDETITLSFEETELLYDPMTRSWINSDISDLQYLNVDNIGIESIHIDEQVLVTDYIQLFFSCKYKGELFKIPLQIRKGRNTSVVLNKSYIQGNYYYYQLSDNGGDQNSIYSATQFLQSKSSLWRGTTTTLTITFVLNQNDNKNITIEITNLEDVKKYFTQNKLVEIELPQDIFSENDLKSINNVSFNFQYGNELFISTPNLEVTILGNRPTLSFRKNGLIINGQPNQQLEGNDFIEINALSTDKTISIKYLGDDGTPISIGQIAFENGKIVLKDIYISSSYILDS